MGAAAVAGMLVGAPAHAAPTPPDRIPDTGARPLPAGPVPLPGGAAAGAPVGGAPAPDSLVTRLTRAEADVTRLGQQVTQATLDRDQAAHEVATLTAAVRAARAALATARRTGQVAAESAYKSAAGVPEEILDSDLRGIGALTGRSRGPDGGVAGGLLARAAATADAAEAALTDARTRHRAAAGRLAEAGTRLRAAERALGDLRRRDPVRTSTVERQRDRRDASMGRGTWQDAADLTAHPKVRAVLAYALRQVGKPYALNAEGPDRFDCSGLTMMAYRAAGFALPRVAAPQYAATADKRVDPKRLVPGDLLFFNLTGDPADIHHV
ncbi:MAG TPA: NlpC/P60 family protein, partial [Pilimelia sp.]|nr:NlpC/P60 family protein [Pilimelia sp.]